jgi:hypothetical protein
MTQTSLETVPARLRAAIDVLFPASELSHHPAVSPLAEADSGLETNSRRLERDEGFYWGVGTCGY